MQKRLLYVAAFLVLTAILMGFSNNAEQHTATGDNNGMSAANSEDTDSIQKGTSGVIAKIKELQNLTEEDTDNMEDINELGEAIEKNWNSIEKKVEASYPEDYKHIEKSLYPLIAAAKKDKVDKTSLRTLSLETLDKLEAFKQKL